jgi:hypothetical protein
MEMVDNTLLSLTIYIEGERRGIPLCLTFHDEGISWWLSPVALLPRRGRIVVATNLK